jgi:hypothetical protein
MECQACAPATTVNGEASAQYSSAGYSSGQADVSLFYDSLAPYGQWFSYGSYGWVWTPYDVPPGWRPYEDGHWAYSEFGWTWVSDYDWGWAPFHYGRWLFDSDYGWLWVPDTVWGPAWVAWRVSDDWVGWAPLPPAATWQASVGVNYSSNDLDRQIAPHSWCFVQKRWIADPGLRDRVAPAPRNVSLVPSTRLTIDYGTLSQRPVNRGPEVMQIEESAHLRVPRMHVQDAGTPGRTVVSGQSLRIFRPDVHPASERPPRMTPAERPQPQISDDELKAKKDTESRRLDSYFDEQRRRLEAAQREELSRPPAGTPPEELTRRHQQEEKALEEQRQIQRQVLENRFTKRIVKPRGNGRRERG